MSIRVNPQMRTRYYAQQTAEYCSHVYDKVNGNKYRFLCIVICNVQETARRWTFYRGLLLMQTHKLIFFSNCFFV